MASRIIHLAICNEIKKNISIKNEERFSIGIMLPDALKNRNFENHEIAHYIEKIPSQEIEVYMFDKFKEQYDEKINQDDLYIGYYLHLIQDAIWWYSYKKWDLLEKMKIDENFGSKIYMDYYITNEYIIPKYNLKNDLIPVNKDLPNLMEFNTQNWIQEVENDFHRKTKIEALNYLKLENIYEYIEDCKNICIQEIQNIYEGKGPQLSEKQFYF